MNILLRGRKNRAKSESHISKAEHNTTQDSRQNTTQHKTVESEVTSEAQHNQHNNSQPKGCPNQ